MHNFMKNTAFPTPRFRPQAMPPAPLAFLPGIHYNHHIIHLPCPAAGMPDKEPAPMRNAKIVYTAGLRKTEAA